MNIRVEVLPSRIFFRLVSCRCCGGLINLIIHEDTVSQLTHICGSRMALQKRLHVYTLITCVPKTNKLFSENAGRIPRPDEVAEIVGLSVENLSMVLQVSKDQPFRRGSYITHMHLVPDEDAETATEIFMRKLLRDEMTKLIGSISPKEAEVLRCLNLIIF
ncbi:uncharacterized protein LOC126410294 isoform X2 [Nymphaea colorata]|uniref:uncharacterized protein LOC126410294 isoform X2 n=1 Tax=Nymphaea colorata TaxID=210225 RepID=UPI00214ECC72|nr:uncharacterized protein LOC126410294 isoform X2 [Nymphaea colorata]